MAPHLTLLRAAEGAATIRSASTTTTSSRRQPLYQRWCTTCGTSGPSPPPLPRRRGVRSSRETMRCSCNFPATHLLPCRHVLTMNLYLYGAAFNRGQVGQRWLRYYRPVAAIEQSSSHPIGLPPPLPTEPIPSFLSTSHLPAVHAGEAGEIRPDHGLRYDHMHKSSGVPADLACGAHVDGESSEVGGGQHVRTGSHPTTTPHPPVPLYGGSCAVSPPSLCRCPAADTSSAQAEAGGSTEREQTGGTGREGRQEAAAERIAAVLRCRYCNRAGRW